MMKIEDIFRSVYYDPNHPASFGTVFHQAKYMRNVSLNAHYLIIMKNPRDKSQIISLARQLYPTNMKFLTEAYNDATINQYSYIKIDLTSSTPDKYRIQARITPEEISSNINQNVSPIIYQPK